PRARPGALSGLAGGRCPAEPAAGVWRGGAPAADCVLEPGEPAAGEDCRAAAGDRGAAGIGKQPVAAAAAVSERESAADGYRRRRGPAGGAGASDRYGRGGSPASAHVGADPAGCDGAALQPDGGVRDGRAVQPGADADCDPAGPSGNAEG